jgi:hypothetical protein
MDNNISEAKEQNPITGAQAAVALASAYTETSDDYNCKFNAILGDLGLQPDRDGRVSVALEVWVGIEQDLADASGYHVVLQGAILEPIEGSQNTFRTVGLRDLATAEPTLYVTEA